MPAATCPRRPASACRAGRHAEWRQRCPGPLNAGNIPRPQSPFSTTCQRHLPGAAEPPCARGGLQGPCPPTLMVLPTLTRFRSGGFVASGPPEEILLAGVGPQNPTPRPSQALARSATCSRLQDRHQALMDSPAPGCRRPARASVDRVQVQALKKQTSRCRPAPESDLDTVLGMSA